jgi:hypothetical protein
MAAAAVPARPTIATEWWFRLIVRAVLALLALWVLVFAEDRHAAFENDWRANFEMDVALWLAWLGRPPRRASCSDWRRGCHSRRSATFGVGCCSPPSRSSRSLSSGCSSATRFEVRRNAGSIALIGSSVGRA